MSKRRREKVRPTKDYTKGTFIGALRDACMACALIWTILAGVFYLVIFKLLKKEQTETNLWLLFIITGVIATVFFIYVALYSVLYEFLSFVIAVGIPIGLYLLTSKYFETELEYLEALKMPFVIYFFTCIVLYIALCPVVKKINIRKEAIARADRELREHLEFMQRQQEFQKQVDEMLAQDCEVTQINFHR